jgi:hypothetical protein
MVPVSRFSSILKIESNRHISIASQEMTRVKRLAQAKINETNKKKKYSPLLFCPAKGHCPAKGQLQMSSLCLTKFGR